MLSFLSGQDIFNQHKNKDAIKNILALLMIIVINADGEATPKEQAKILEFFKNEFGQNKDETIAFFNNIVGKKSDFSTLCDELKVTLQNDAMAKAKALHHLNDVILCDGCTDEEYDIFEKIRIDLK